MEDEESKVSICKYEYVRIRVRNGVSAAVLFVCSDRIIS